MGTIIDVVLIAVAAIAFIVGLVKGFVKQFTGLLGALVSFFGSIVFVAVIMPYIHQTEIFQNFTSIAVGWFSGETFVTEATSAEEVAALLEQGGALKILSGLSEQIFSYMENFECSTIGQLAGFFTADIIVELVLWIIFFVIVKLVFRGLRSLLLKLADLPVLHSIDRIFGGVWSLIITYIVVIGLILTLVEVVILRFMPDKWEAVAAIIEQSKLLPIAHDTNILGSLVAPFAGVEIPPIAAVPVE